MAIFIDDTNGDLIGRTFDTEGDNFVSDATSCLGSALHLNTFHYFLIICN